MLFPSHIRKKSSRPYSILVLSLILIFTGILFTSAQAVTAKKQYHSAAEYNIKAGFIYKFLLLVEWPENNATADRNSIIIATVGGNPFGDAFQAIEGMEVKNKTIEFHHYNKSIPADQLEKCDLLYIDPDIEEQIPLILKEINGLPILTVSETTGFLQMGGMINFVDAEKDRVRFELNRSSAHKAGITFRSKLLRVAAEVVE